MHRLNVFMDFRNYLLDKHGAVLNVDKYIFTYEVSLDCGSAIGYKNIKIVEG